MGEEELPVNLLVIGAGSIFRAVHLAALREIGVPPKAVIDPDQRALGAVKGSLPGASLIASKTVQIPGAVNCALICSPSGLHAAQTTTALEAGLDVLCEKPLACSGRDAKAVYELAQARGRTLVAGYYRRFHPASAKMKELLTSAELGAPRRLTICAGSPAASGPAALFNRELAGGGMLMDYGVHVVDQLYYWFDQIELKSYADDNFGGGFEANSYIEIDSRIGDVVVPTTVSLSRTHDIGYFATIEFENASIRYFLNEGHRLKLFASRRVRWDGADRELGNDVFVGPARSPVGYFADQFKEFVHRMRPTANDEPRIANTADAVRVSEFVDHCYAVRKPLTFECGW